MVEKMQLQELSVAELHKLGSDAITDATNTVLDAIREQASVDLIVQLLVDFANRPRNDCDAMNDAGADVFDLICTAYAVLVAADQYDPDKPHERESAAWFRDMAKTYLHHAADRFGSLAAKLAVSNKPGTLH